MRRIRAVVALLSLLVVVAIAASQVPVATAQSTEGVTVEIHPAATDGAVGDTFDIEVTVVNRGPEITPRLAAHIDVTDPGSESSVDPEDWTPTLTRAVGALAPGTQVTLRWKIQPISAGSYVLYAVALVADRQATPAAAVSNAVLVAISERRSLNPSGVLPVVLAVPILLGGAILIRRRQQSRTDLPRQARGASS